MYVLEQMGKVVQRYGLKVADAIALSCTESGTVRLEWNTPLARSGPKDSGARPGPVATGALGQSVESLPAFLPERVPVVCGHLEGQLILKELLVELPASAISPQGQSTGAAAAAAAAGAMQRVTLPELERLAGKASSPEQLPSWLHCRTCVLTRRPRDIDRRPTSESGRRRCWYAARRSVASHWGPGLSPGGWSLGGSS